jgi:hypothetical protein
MFGKLFNRKELEKKIEILQARIDELESKNRVLSTRLSKQEVRTKKAVSDKQEADLALKKAEKEIENLEHTLENLKEGKQKSDEQTLTFKRAVTLTNAQSCDLLSQIGSVSSRNEDLLTVYLRPNESITDLKEFESAIELDQDVKYMMQRIESPTGMALFYDMKRMGMVLEQNQVICIVLAHAGETFIGISNREAVIDHKIVRSSVKEKHTKGGMSQRRFERLRDEDIKHHAEKVRGVFEALVDEYKNELKMVVASGEHNLVKEITGGDSGYRYSFPLLIRSIDLNAKVEKQNIDKIRVLAWSARWYLLKIGGDFEQTMKND